MTIINFFFGWRANDSSTGRSEEYWEPMVDGLEQIVVKRNIPCVHILLSLDEIDPSTPGYALRIRGDLSPKFHFCSVCLQIRYQFSKTKTLFWNEPERQPSQRPSTSGNVTPANTSKPNPQSRRNKSANKSKTKPRQSSQMDVD